MTFRTRTATVSAALLAIAAAATLAATPATAEGKPRHTDTQRLERPHAPDRALTDRGKTPWGAAAEVTSEGIPGYRIAGSNRISTAIAAAQLFDSHDDPDPAAWTASAVVLSRSDFYADALGGTPLAGAANGPLLLTPPGYLHDAVKTEIDRLLGGSGTVYLLGGTGALSTDVEKALTAAGYTAVRLAGADRFETSVRVAEEVETVIGRVPDPVLVTTGLNYPDGLAAGATAASYLGVVVLSKDAQLTPTVASYLDKVRNEADPWIEAVGGQAGAAPFDWAWVTAGTNRYETASILAHDWWADPQWDHRVPHGVGLTTGLNWPDALSGGAFMAGWGPLLLSRTDSVPGGTLNTVTQLANQASPSPIDAGVVFGGPTAVTEDAAWQFVVALNS